MRLPTYSMQNQQHFDLSVTVVSSACLSATVVSSAFPTCSESWCKNRGLLIVRASDRCTPFPLPSNCLPQVPAPMAKGKFEAAAEIAKNLPRHASLKRSGDDELYVRISIPARQKFLTDFCSCTHTTCKVGLSAVPAGHP